MRKYKFLLALLAILILTGCAKADSGSQYITSYEEINGKKTGCMSGSIFDALLKENFPDSEIVYYNSRSELLLGIKTNKIVTYIADEPVAMMAVAQNNDITYLDKSVGEVNYGMCFSKSVLNVRDEFNQYLQSLKQSGKLDALIEKWICVDGTSKKKEEYKLTGENGTLRVVTTPDAAPFSFQSEGSFQGFEVELLTLFCYEKGYDLTFDTLSFDSLLTSISTGKYDIAMNGIYITEQRKQSVDFCDSYYSGRDVLVVLKENTGEKLGFFDTIKNSFYRNFIEEARYKLIGQGVLTTIILSICSVVCGSLLGLLVFFYSRNNKILKSFADLIQKILARLPAVVLLMVAFYVIFKNISAGVVVSIIVFSILFSGTVYGLLKEGNAAIDYGQYEAAISLGYSDSKAFFRMILPQAIKVVFNTYSAETISLLKQTSIVGYVSVSDLTRMSDIIRGRTYDALLPLIVVAIIYFVLCTLFSKLVKVIFNKYSEVISK